MPQTHHRLGPKRPPASLALHPKRSGPKWSLTTTQQEKGSAHPGRDGRGRGDGRGKGRGRGADPARPIPPVPRLGYRTWYVLPPCPAQPRRPSPGLTSPAPPTCARPPSREGGGSPSRVSRAAGEGGDRKRCGGLRKLVPRLAGWGVLGWTVGEAKGSPQMGLMLRNWLTHCGHL